MVMISFYILYYYLKFRVFIGNYLFQTIAIPMRLLTSYPFFRSYDMENAYWIFMPRLSYNLVDYLCLLWNGHRLWHEQPHLLSNDYHSNMFGDLTGGLLGEHSAAIPYFVYLFQFQ